MGEELENHLTNTILKLEEIDVNLYRGSNLWKPVRSRAVFGGQVVGQALVAASKTVADHLHVHSLHTYFIRPGDNTLPILYHVDRLRDGNSFSTRSVKATQNGNTIITMQVSYHKEEEGVLSHQYTMPHAPPPDKLRTTEECLRTFLQDTRTSKQSKATIQKVLADEIPIEVKPVDPLLFFSRKRHSDVHTSTYNQGVITPWYNLVVNIVVVADISRGSNLWKPVRSRAVFGGQVVGQALVAASKTVADHLHVHSLHTYFIRPGDNTLPILYHVDCLRDGNSFSTRSVKATQNGNTIITMQVSEG
ncbi:acyl-coenzyme A thioesterase 8 [Lingula anatina]|uniref:Acyl-coenzyme A thioesterase 8 n=1 Tax=Lingula anatina TaxID=7574 RepID=A0A1S3J022_LINAN|nr:acyl-coenzyme A thioesterase 8 [Lingula anatina]|eukprot:XP_013403795.1 acyl-coenzyme A thioesterase 8 [Lingula anatina]